MLKVLVGTKDISEFVSSLTWSGDLGQAARKVEFSYVQSDSMQKVNVSLGNQVRVLYDNKEIFRGYVFYKEIDTENDTVRVTAYDGLIYLLKNKATYNFKNITADAITRKIAQDFGIQVGSLASANLRQKLIVEGETLYDIIMKAYTNESKHTGKKYMPLFREGKLNIIEKGKTVVNYVLSSSENISNVTYSESLENMINRVKIYDENEKYIGKVENGEWIRAYGILQDVYTKEKDKNAYTVARNMLRGIEKTLNIRALGNVDCITGMAVKVKDKATGLTGLFYIDSDTHTFENGQHMMDLTLNFQNIMDEKSE
ncbi:XkdQ/YqbQ family protein [Caldanaerobacter subterraneus]|uniref:YqbQ/XkdQ domain-containing protein n=1 Tax=Caldanaerobacter subterraneus TaxID=911092 RepID=A0A7Y2L7Q6_9THEO|nr:hypothetical protein [Caldanaerobacter subterraneus]NNG67349.1 hypothetical protein [Caldanaerobacter subterraneus]